MSSLNESLKKKNNTKLLLQGINFEKEQSKEHFAEYETVFGIYSMSVPPLNISYNHALVSLATYTHTPKTFISHTVSLFSIIAIYNDINLATLLLE